MYKGIALSTLGDYMPTTSDIFALKTRKVDTLRLEIGPRMGPGPLAYLTREGISLVALVGMGLLPRVPNAAWNAPVASAAFQDLCAAWQQAVRTALHNTAGAETIPFVELFNEPNGNIAPGGTGLHPANFAHLYRAAHDVIVHEHPGTRVISGGLFAHAESGVAYLQQAHAALPIHWDYTGYHPYLDSGGGLQAAHLDAFIREVYARSGKPLFITEVGWQTSVVGPAVQASNFATLFRVARATTLVAGVLAFTLDDAPGATPPMTYGIRDKQAWWDFPTY